MVSNDQRTKYQKKTLSVMVSARVWILVNARFVTDRCNG